MRHTVCRWSAISRGMAALLLASTGAAHGAHPPALRRHVARGDAGRSVAGCGQSWTQAGLRFPDPRRRIRCGATCAGGALEGAERRPPLAVLAAARRALSRRLAADGRERSAVAGALVQTVSVDFGADARRFADLHYRFARSGVARGTGAERVRDCRSGCSPAMRLARARFASFRMPTMC